MNDDSPPLPFLSVPWCIALALAGVLAGLWLMTALPLDPPTDAMRTNLRRLERIKEISEECGKHPPIDAACVQRHLERNPS